MRVVAPHRASGPAPSPRARRAEPGPRPGPPDLPLPGRICYWARTDINGYDEDLEGVAHPLGY